MFEEIDLQVSKYSSRDELRRIVLFKFMEEKPGLGSGDRTSKYRYNVEVLKDGRRIYLTRPAYLKKGFDFRINVENTIFQTGHEYPKHDDIFDDLKSKKEENAAMAEQLHQAITRVYECEDPNDILPKYSNVKFKEGQPVDFILKVIKWFLIEQDIRDWNYSGRGMFKHGVDSILL